MKKPLRQDDALLADIAARRDDHSDTLNLWWLGQSGFLMQCHGRHVLFDPYLSDSLTRKYANTAKPHVRISERIIAPERLDFVDVITSTHGHTDHLDSETLVPICRAITSRWVEHSGCSPDTAPNPHLLFAAATQALVDERLKGEWVFPEPMNAWHQQTARKVKFTAVPAAHDTREKDADGHDRYLGFVCQYRGHTIYHSGDTVVYDGMADDLRPFDIDVALLPINGKVGNMSGRDAARLAKDISAKLVIPCHYDMFEFNTADPAEEFVPECERLGQPYRVLQQGERWSSDELAT